MAVPLVYQMLRGKRRAYIIDEVKAPLLKSIIKIGSGYPFLKQEDLSNNGRILLDISRKFESCNTARANLFAAGFNIAINLYEKPDEIPLRLKTAAITYGLKYFEPKRANILLPNTGILFDVEDACHSVYPATQYSRACFRIVKCEYEHDPFYRYRMDWWLEEIVEAFVSGRWIPRESWIDLALKLLVDAVREGRWQPRPKGRPGPYWRKLPQEV